MEPSVKKVKPSVSHDELSSSDLGTVLHDITLIFTDLDGTLYPGPLYECEPKEKKLGLKRNLKEVDNIEKLGVPVVPATGNNVCFAQKKMVDPLTGEKARDLRTNPGIFCNGALVKGKNGKEIDVRHLGHFIPTLLDKWLSEGPQIRPYVCLIGLCKERVIALKDAESEQGIRAGMEYKKTMMLEEDEFEWLDASTFAADSESVLSFVMLFTAETQPDDRKLLELQNWLSMTGLIQFPDPLGRKSDGKSNGDGDDLGVICKHVRSPGCGPELDVSPFGVNKGSAILKLLRECETHLGISCPGSEQVAVFGDSGNDVELFGMKRNSMGTELEPLGLGFRPAIRVAMPWADDRLLRSDANMVGTFDMILQQMIKEKEARP